VDLLILVSGPPRQRGPWSSRGPGDPVPSGAVPADRYPDGACHRRAPARHGDGWWWQPADAVRGAGRRQRPVHPAV